MEKETLLLPGIEPAPSNSVNESLLSDEQLVDLQRRVVTNEPISDEELRNALRTLATRRANASQASAMARTSKEVVVSPKGSISDRFAAFKAKTQNPTAS